MELDEEPANLHLILNELRGIGKELNDFRQDNNRQLTDLKEELAKTNTKIEDVENRVAEHEDKLQQSDEIIAEMLTM